MTSAPSPFNSSTTAPRLPLGFREHEAAHGSQKCGRCIWARCQEKWLAATPIHQRSASEESWLEARPVNSAKWGLGCWVCRQLSKGTLAAGQFADFGLRRGLQKVSLLRHQKSARHQRACQALMTSRGFAGEDHLPAPPVTEFQALLLRVRRGQLESTGMNEHKAASMSWCLYEAYREAERKFLAKAT